MSPDEFKRRVRDRVMPVVLAALVVSTIVNGLVGCVALRADKSADTANQALAEIETERVIRTHENCLISEKKQASDIEQLRRSYDFLADPPMALRSLVPYALAQLPRIRLEAEEDDAPPYCDEPGARAEARGEPPVGLPEPDPKLPRRPPNLP